MKKIAGLSQKFILVLLLLLNGGKFWGMEIPPIVSNISYCQYETANPLEATINPGPGLTATDYELRWYESENFWSSYTTLAPTPSTVTVGEKEYFVSQFNKMTHAESNHSPLKVTVYAKPALATTSPSAACTTLGQAVDITRKDAVWSVINEGTLPLTVSYYDTDQITQLSNTQASALSRTGISSYYIKAEFTMPVNYAGLSTCSSDLQSVVVTVEDLYVAIIGSDKACPYDELALSCLTDAQYNSGIYSPIYSWSGNGKTSNGSLFPTGALPTTKGDKVDFNLTVSAGSCTNIAAAVHTIEIGDGPIEGIMKISEQLDGITSDETFNSAGMVDYYSCGGKLVITTSYNYTGPNGFEWYLDNALVGIGPDLQIADMTAGTRTYRLKYENKCPTYVDVTIHSIPVSVTNSNSPMGLCEGGDFKAELYIASTTPTTIRWTKDGNSLPAFNDNPVFSIASAKPSDSGVYKYSVANQKCAAEGYINSGTKLNVSDSVRLQLLPPITVCEGEEVYIGLSSYTPVMTQFSWGYDPTITSSINTPTTSVIPPYQPSESSNHRSKYTYMLTGTFQYCQVQIPIDVYVDEPLNGYIVGDGLICEGRSVEMNASSYNATSYIWTSPNAGQKSGTTITAYPTETSTYYVDMERGACFKRDLFTVEVSSNPRIGMIDSLGVQVREIVTLPGYGTLPFLYGVDNLPMDNDPVKTNLSFGTHTFFVVDVLGCHSETVGYFLEDPEFSNTVLTIANTPVEIYPNPFTDQLEIENAANYNLTVTDMQGRIQYQRSNLTTHEIIPTSGWSAGIYLINLSSQDNNIVRKVVKYRE